MFFLQVYINMTEKEIRESAKIYRKENIRPLSDYQKKINDSAGSICIENPAMLKSRARLLSLARDIVDSDYALKKGKSRSKRYLTMDSSQKPKRLVKKFVRKE